MEKNIFKGSFWRGFIDGIIIIIFFTSLIMTVFLDNENDKKHIEVISKIEQCTKR